MILLRALWRVARAVGCGLGYAGLVGVIVSSPFFVLLRLQPPCNQAIDICEDGGLGLLALAALWLGMLVGFVTGIALSAFRARPISDVIRKVAIRLSHARSTVRTVGIVAVVTLVGSVGWLGYWVLTGRGSPPQVSLDIEVPFDQSLAVGLARIETFHQGGGCVRFGTREPNGSSSRSTLVYEISSTRTNEICPGVNQPETQGLLVVAYGDPADPPHPPSEIPVQVYMAPNWYDEPTFGAVSFPSPTPEILELNALSGEVSQDPLIWRIRLHDIDGGFAVPVVTDVQGGLEPSLYKVDEHDNRTDLSSQVGVPSWSHACDLHTCDLGWAVVVWAPDSMEAVTIGIQMEVWIFDTGSNPTLTVASCAEGEVGNYTIECTIETQGD